MIYAETLPEVIKKVWCRDPVLSAAIPGERFYIRQRGLSGETTLPYASLKVFDASSSSRLGDKYYQNVFPGSITIYGTGGLWKLAKQVSILFSNFPKSSCYQGDICYCNVQPGQEMDLSNGTTAVTNNLEFYLIELRSPHRLRMT